MQMTYFPTLQCLHTCSCCYWEPESLPQVHWDGACVRLHTWWVRNREFPVAQSHFWAQLCGPPRKQLCTHPCKGTIHRVLLLMLPFLKNCSVSLAATGLEQHYCLHPKQPQAETENFLSTKWGLGNNGSLEISPVAIFGGRIDLEVLAHVIG